MRIVSYLLKWLRHIANCLWNHNHGCWNLTRQAVSRHGRYRKLDGIRVPVTISARDYIYLSVRWLPPREFAHVTSRVVRRRAGSVAKRTRQAVNVNSSELSELWWSAYKCDLTRIKYWLMELDNSFLNMQSTFIHIIVLGTRTCSFDTQ